MDHQPERAASSIPSACSSFRQILPSEVSDYSQVQALQATFDLPMNWLPPDDSLAIDYDNIVGLGIGSLDFFSLPDSITGLAATQNLRQESITTDGAQRHNHITTTSQRSASDVIEDSEILWNNISPRIVDSCVSIESSRPTAHAVSTCDVPGGLYATSVDGGRKPCTIRARGARRSLPGAAPIRSLKHIQVCPLGEDNILEFPDVSHIAVDDTVITSIENEMRATRLLSDATYNKIMQAFTKLCLNDQSSFPTYKTSRFPELASLNFCVELYFINFDPVMPLLHKAVAWMDDHWLLALAVAAIGCQYVEADEYAQMVEPMHEFLRRAFVVESSVERIGTVDGSRKGLAVAQAMVLGQVGMLYAGSARLLHFAKAQRNAMIELACMLHMPVALTEFSQQNTQHVSHEYVEGTSWEMAMANECKRRLICSIFVGQAHISQYPPGH